MAKWDQLPSHRYPLNVAVLNPPPKNDSTARTRKTTKRIFATPTKEPAIPPKPNKAAIKAMIRQVMASCNMAKLPSKIGRAHIRWQFASTVGKRLLTYSHLPGRQR